MSGDGPEDHAKAGVEHLQAAAREVIKASRSLLDAAEELLDDPRAVEDVVGTITGFAQAAAARLRGQAPPPEHGAGDGSDDDANASSGHVEPIRLS